MRKQKIKILKIMKIRFILFGTTFALLKNEKILQSATLIRMQMYLSLLKKGVIILGKT